MGTRAGTMQRCRVPLAGYGKGLAFRTCEMAARGVLNRGGPSRDLQV